MKKYYLTKVMVLLMTVLLCSGFFGSISTGGEDDDPNGFNAWVKFLEVHLGEEEISSFEVDHLDNNITISGVISGDTSEEPVGELDVYFNVILDGEPLVIRTEYFMELQEGHPGIPTGYEYEFEETVFWDFECEIIGEEAPEYQLEIIDIKNVESDYYPVYTNTGYYCDLTNVIGTKNISMEVVNPKEVYNSHDTIMIDFQFTDEVVLNDSKSYKLNLYSSYEYLDIPYTSIEDLGNNTLRFTYDLDGTDLMFYGQLAVDDLEHIKDNSEKDVIWPFYNEEYGIDNPVIEGERYEFVIHTNPPSYEETKFYDNRNVVLLFSDDMFNDGLEYGKVYIHFTDIQRDPSEWSTLEYFQSNTSYIEMPMESDFYQHKLDLRKDEYNDSIGKDQVWYVYAKIVDVHGNEIYEEVFNGELDRINPALTLEDVVFLNEPEQSFSLDFEIYDNNLMETSFFLWDYVDFNDSTKRDAANYDYTDFMAMATIYEPFNSEPGLIGHKELFTIPDDLLSNDAYTSLGAFIELEETTYGTQKGVVNIKYNYDDDNNLEIPSGVYVLEVLTMDQLGITDVVTKEQLLWVDKHPPNIVTPIERKEVNSEYTVELYVTVNDVVDTRSGAIPSDLVLPQTVEYKWWKLNGDVKESLELSGSEITENSMATIKVPHGEISPGLYSLEIQSVDKAGNRSTMYEEKVEVLDSNASVTIFNNKIDDTGEGDASKYFVTLDYELKDLLIKEGLTDLELRYVNKLDETSSISNASFEDVPNLLFEDKDLQLFVDDVNGVEDDYDFVFEFRYKVNDEWYYLPLVNVELRYDITDPVAKFIYPEDLVPRGTEFVYVVLDYYHDPIGDSIRDEEIEVIPNKAFSSIHTEVDGVHKYKITSNGSYQLMSFKDKVGNTIHSTIDIDCFIDTAEPVSVNYSTIEDTKDSVEVRFIYKDRVDVAKNIWVINGENLLDKIVVDKTDPNDHFFNVLANGLYDVMYEDDYGESSRKTLLVQNIDEGPPTYEVSFSSEEYDTELEIMVNNPTKYNVIAFIDADEACDYIVTSVDEDGKVTTDQGILEKAGRFEILFEENMTKSLVLIDAAGNATEKKDITVSWIDRIKPTVDLEYSDNYYDEVTTEPIIVTVTGMVEGDYVVNNDGETSREFSYNREYEFIIENQAENRVLKKVVINHFNETPEFDVTYNYTTLTNQDVTATITLPIGYSLYYQDASETKIFTENGSQTFTIISDRNKIYYVEIEIDYIDKVAPVLILDSYKDFYTPMGKAITITDDFRILDNVDGEISEFERTDNINWNTPGIYDVIYTFEDRAGNQVSFTRNVEVLDETIRLLINGQKNDGVVYITGDTVELDPINTLGEYMILYINELHKKSFFKSNGIKTSGFSVDINGASEMTFILLDQERGYELVKCIVVDSVSGR